VAEKPKIGQIESPQKVIMGIFEPMAITCQQIELEQTL